VSAQVCDAATTALIAGGVVSGGCCSRPPKSVVAGAQAWIAPAATAVNRTLIDLDANDRDTSASQSDRRGWAGFRPDWKRDAARRRDTGTGSRIARCPDTGSVRSALRFGNVNVTSSTMRFSFLLLATLVFSHASEPQANGAITVRSAGRDSVLTAAQLATIPRHDLRVAGEGSTDSATVSGISLWDLLQKAGVPPATASGRQRGASYVRLKGSDGQSAVFGLVEIDPSFSRRTVLIAERRNGQPLDAVEGPWRAFVPDDIRHARWIRQLVLVEVDTLKP
jgi:hypothetical protein